MRRFVRALGGVVIGVAMVAAGVARADMTVQITGTEASGMRMQASCDLQPLSPPSNTFVGKCELIFGNERLVIAGLDVNGQPTLSAVLDGRITIRGLAQSTSARFRQMASEGAAGFPVYLHIDPFGRAWALERDVPGAGRVAVGGGPISEGSIALGIK
jgi:hypothetical protein